MKQEVAKRDQQLAELKEEIQAEKLAIEKLNMLINKYHPHGLTASFGGTGESGLQVIGANQQLEEDEDDYRPRNRVPESYRKATSASIAQERREKESDRDGRSVRSGSTISTATQQTMPSQRPLSALSRHAKLNRTAATASGATSSSVRK